MTNILEERIDDDAGTLASRASDDPLRPVYHFTAPRNWLNDPNGLIQWKGIYHLFYQYTPDSPLSGLKHWGHASSRDLVHWQDHPIAISPTPGSADEDGIYSGCAVDADGIPTAFYSGIQGPNQLICRATGDDQLREWTKDPGNPVVAAVPEGLDLLTTPDGTVHYRDPSVWQEDGAWWMTVGSGITGVGGTVLLYRSADLQSWKYVGPILVGDAGQRDPVWTGTMWECPQLFPLGDRHVLLISVWHERKTLYTAYMVGAYIDGRFTPDHTAILDPGSFYAPQTFADEQGRRIMFGWLREQRSREAMAASSWTGAMTIPWIISLGDDNCLHYEPVPELKALRRDHQRGADIDLQAGTLQLLPDFSGDSLELDVEIDPGSAEAVSIVIRRSPNGEEQTRIVYEPHNETIWIDRSRSSLGDAVDRTRHDMVLEVRDEPLRLRVFLDRSVIEVVANERTMLSERIYPTRDDSIDLAALAEGGDATITRIDRWVMSFE